MMVTIEFTDEQAKVLKQQAESEGLTLESWLRKIADQHVARASVVEPMRRIRSRVSPDPEGWTVRDYIAYGRRLTAADRRRRLGCTCMGAA